MSINTDGNVRGLLFNGCYLLGKRESLESAQFPGALTSQVGSIICKSFVNYPYFFAFTSINDISFAPSVSLKYKSMLNHYVSFLWFVKDNSTSLATVVSFVPEHDRASITTTPHYTNAKGLMEEVHYSYEELEEASRIYSIIARLQSETNTKMPELTPSERPTVVHSISHYKGYNEHNRIERALNFLNMARTNSFLPIKISSYISVLECLFTNDTSEVTHKVSERAAAYIGGDAMTRYENYKVIKKAYEIRSKFLHGQAFKKQDHSREGLEKISSQTDTLLRTILRNVVLKDTRTFLEKDMNKFYDDVVFGITTP